MSRHTWFYGLIVFLLFGCGSAPIECSDEGDCTDMTNKIGMRLTTLTRTTAIGSSTTDLPPGLQLPSLQVLDLEPGEYTIQFQGLPPADGNGFACYAIINWKIGGQQLVRKISVFSGAAITGLAEAVDVQLVDYSGVGVIVGSTAEYQIAAALSRGSRATIQQPATLSTQPTEVGITAGSTESFVIPQDAGVVSFMPLVRVGGTYTPDQLDVTAANAATNTVQGWNVDPQNPVWVPLPPGAKDVTFRNGTANSIGVNVVWGVEG